jgi:hypothetical protein
MIIDFVGSQGSLVPKPKVRLHGQSAEAVANAGEVGVHGCQVLHDGRLPLLFAVLDVPLVAQRNDALVARPTRDLLRWLVVANRVTGGG